MITDVQKPVLVIGASGLVGRRLALALLTQGYSVRCLVRNPATVGDLSTAGCEIHKGDIADAAAVHNAIDGVQAVYVAIHTLSPQPGGKQGAGFMDIEKMGLENVVAGCWEHAVRRIISVTSLGVAPDARSEWLRGRWQVEQDLINSGFDATVFRPGMIVGVGGQGFDTMTGHASRRVAYTLGGDRPTMRTIALDDLVFYLTSSLKEERTYGKGFDVGNDDVLSTNALIDGIADVLGKPRPLKRQLPLPLIRGMSSIIDRISKLPRGAMRGLLDSLEVDLIGDPLPIRAIFPRSLLSYSEAVRLELLNKTAPL